MATAKKLSFAEPKQLPHLSTLTATFGIKFNSVSQEFDSQGFEFELNGFTYILSGGTYAP